MHQTFRTLSGIAFALCLSLTARAEFVLFDNFNSYSPNANLVGQGPTGNAWSQTIGSPTGMVTRVFGDGLGVVTGPTGPSAAFRALGPAGLTIDKNSSAAAVYWQFTVGASPTNNNWNFVVTDVNPTDTAGTSEVQFNYDSTAGNFRARNAGAFKNLSTDGTAAGNVLVLAGATYDVWFEINNASDNYRIFMQADGVPGLLTPVQVFANDGSGGVFGFRNGAANNDLINVNFGSGNGQPVETTFDNIYVDISGFNFTKPVPEPATWALLGMGGLLLFRRRRA